MDALSWISLSYILGVPVTAVVLFAVLIVVNNADVEKRNEDIFTLSVFSIVSGVIWPLLAVPYFIYYAFLYTGFGLAKIIRRVSGPTPSDTPK